MAPSILFGDNAFSEDIFKDGGVEYQSRHKPSPSDVLAARFEESTFFQTYELDPRQESLGDGSFSVCRRCRHRKTLREFAVKIVSRRMDGRGEASMLRACQGHPNIVKLIEVHQDRAHTYFVMELLLGGELSKRSRRLTERQASRIMRQLGSAVHFMHSRGIVHRDLKPENLVFADDGEDAPIKVVDFGFARLKRGCEPLRTPCFTLPYAAPEVLGRQGYDESCDLWSLGAVLYSILSGEPPPTRTRTNADEEIDLNGNAWRRVSPLAKRVVGGLLTADPSKRLTAVSLVNHPWLLEHSPDEAVEIDSTERSEKKLESGFRLRDVQAAKLAQRRKLHKRSNSSSVSSSTSTASSSFLSVQRLKLSNATISASIGATSSPARPNAFDFGEDKVNEYLSSLSSSSDSNSPIISNVKISNEERSKDVPEVTTAWPIESSYEVFDRTCGPITRSRKRKLERLDCAVSSKKTLCDVPPVKDQREVNIHRKQKTRKRFGRVPNIQI